MYGYGYLNSFKTLGGGTPPVSYLVDLYSPTAAFSIRKISSTATNCIRVRRSNDNAEQDIGFSGVELDTASLLSFIGANSGYITKWYNQGTGGSTYDCLNASGTAQPRIVNAGTIDTKNGKTAAYFDGGDGLQSANNIGITTNTYSSWAVGSNESASTKRIIWGTQYMNLLVSRGAGKELLETTSGVTSVLYNSQQDNNNQRLIGGIGSGTSVTGYFNGTQQGTDSTLPASITNGVVKIGGTYGFSLELIGYAQEIIIFPSTDQTANRTAIETDINTYYGIY